MADEHVQSMNEEQIAALQATFYASTGEHPPDLQERLRAQLEELADEPSVIDDGVDIPDSERAAYEVIGALMDQQGIGADDSIADAEFVAQYQAERQRQLAEIEREYNAIESVAEFAARVIVHCGELRRAAFVVTSTEGIEDILERAYLLDVVLDTPKWVHSSQHDRGKLRTAQARVDHLKQSIQRHWDV